MSNGSKSILVTGANSGIGQAMAEYLVSQGFHVYAGARNTVDLENLRKNPNITPVKLDVTNAEDIIEVKKIIEQNAVGLFGLVNNAGITKAGPLMDVSVEDLRAQFEVNLFGVHQITQALFPLLLQAKGRIVMMSSDSGFFATPFVGPYCSSKFALEGYSDSLRREIIPYGVKVILIEPGRIKTPIWDKGEKILKSEKHARSIFWKEAKAIGEYAIQKGKTSGLPPIAVAKTVYHALTVVNPKLRYIVAENSFEYKLMKILPAWYVDKLVLKKVHEVTRLAAQKAEELK
ncbi:MAG: SDR family oxidoreductase [Smithellaceae bacterium]|jgi:NAD(P)-dependent dehydrogenase (short-subunit alcohol dehydrogenase family)